MIDLMFSESQLFNCVNLKLISSKNVDISQIYVHQRSCSWRLNGYANDSGRMQAERPDQNA